MSAVSYPPKLVDRLIDAACILADECDEELEGDHDHSQDDILHAVEDVRQAMADIAVMRYQAAGQQELFGGSRPIGAGPVEADVRPNWCRCHPETCCCNDWAVFVGDEKHLTHFRRKDAELVARALNARLVLEQIREWDIANYQERGHFALPESLRSMIQRVVA